MPSDPPESDEDTAPWEQSELAPSQRRRRLIVLAVVVVGFVGGAALWSFGFGRNLSGHIGAKAGYEEERRLQGALSVAPEDNYTLELARCDVEQDSGRVEVGGTLTLSEGVRGGSYEVVVAFLSGDEDVTVVEGIDEATLVGGGDSAPLDMIAYVLPDTPTVECIPLRVARRSGTEPVPSTSATATTATTTTDPGSDPAGETDTSS
ncbi:MAG: hypothetical protein R2754_01295 [Microthrixaceae bacterium]